MSKTYELPVSLIFKGKVIVEAEHVVEARELVRKHFSGTIDSVGDKTMVAFKDWYFPKHSTETKIFKHAKLLKNESKQS